MKRRLSLPTLSNVIALLLILGFIAACSLITSKPGSPSLPGIVVLEARQLPSTKTLSWTPNAASDNVTNYTVMLDGVVIGIPTTASQSVTFTTQGNHTLTVTATNQFGTSAPGTLVVNVVIPATPGGLKIAMIVGHLPFIDLVNE